MKHTAISIPVVTLALMVTVVTFTFHTAWAQEYVVHPSTQTPERLVPQETNMPDEVPSPTQPFPTKPAPLDNQDVTIDDLVDFTPAIRQMAVDAVRGFKLGPLFTPPTRPIEGGIRGTLMRPTDVGAAGWGGAAMDPETGLLYVPSRNRATVISLYQPAPAAGATVRYTHGAPEAER